jgi:hypothetical protein
MMVPREFLGPYLAANAFALATLGIAFWNRTAARWIGVAVFAWAAGTNTWFALTRPEVYLEYAALTPSMLYRDFILGWFSRHIPLMVLCIAAGQLTIAALMASRRDTHRIVALAGALVFLLAISPLGVGSGFPFSLTFGAALAVSAGAGRRHWQPRLAE